jgi:hypothetical protein
MPGDPLPWEGGGGGAQLPVCACLPILMGGGK